MLTQTVVQLVLCGMGFVFLTGSISYFLKEKNQQGVYLLITFFVLESTALLVRYCPLIYAKLKNQDCTLPPPYCLVSGDTMYGQSRDTINLYTSDDDEPSKYGTFRTSEDSFCNSSMYHSFHENVFGSAILSRSAYDTAFLDSSREQEFQSHSYPGPSGRHSSNMFPRLNSFRSALSDIFPSKSSISGVVDDMKVTEI